MFEIKNNLYRLKMYMNNRPPAEAGGFVFAGEAGRVASLLVNQLIYQTETVETLGYFCLDI